MGTVRGNPIASALAALVLLALTLTGCASAQRSQPTAGATAPGTAQVAFRAYTAGGTLAVPKEATVRGQCWTTSVAAPVAGAFRCFQGNKILDPCFARPGSSVAKMPAVLACLATPWSRAVLLRVTGSLPKPEAGSAGDRPWAFELKNGVRCIASTGTVPAVDGVNLGYHCLDGGNAELGGVDGALLTAQYVAAGARTLTPLGVTTIWRA
jgi:hypothetical protein